MSVRGAFVSLTSGAASGDDASYLRWHLLDHQPEQYTIPEIRLGTRWRADEPCLARRTAASDDLAPVRHAVCYRLTEPREDALVEFARLGRRLADEGRYPEPATPHLLGAYEVHALRASPAAVVSDEAVPFRPHRGVYVIVESGTDAALDDGFWRWHDAEHVPAVLDTDGVDGLLVLRRTDRVGRGPEQGPRFGAAAPWDPGGSAVTLVYVDGDLLATTERLAPIVGTRWAHDVAPRLAGPFRSPVAYEAWPDGP